MGYGMLSTFSAVVRQSPLADYGEVGNWQHSDFLPNIPVFQYSSIPTPCNEMLITP
jgi:hypothetical protein